MRVVASDSVAQRQQPRRNRVFKDCELMAATSLKQSSRQAASQRELSVRPESRMTAVGQEWPLTNGSFPTGRRYGEVVDRGPERSIAHLLANFQAGQQFLCGTAQDRPLVSRPLRRSDRRSQNGGSSSSA